MKGLLGILQKFLSSLANDGKFLTRSEPIFREFHDVGFHLFANA